MGLEARSIHTLCAATGRDVRITCTGREEPVWSYLHALVLAHDAGQLQVTLDLLADLLEAVDDGHGGDGVDAAQDVQRHVDQALRGEAVSVWLLNSNNI